MIVPTSLVRAAPRLLKRRRPKRQETPMPRQQRARNGNERRAVKRVFRGERWRRRHNSTTRRLTGRMLSTPTAKHVMPCVSAGLRVDSRSAESWTPGHPDKCCVAVDWKKTNTQLELRNSNSSLKEAAMSLGPVWWRQWQPGGNRVQPILRRGYGHCRTPRQRPSSNTQCKP